MPFKLIHGEALVACAAWALGDAGVTPVDPGTPWAGLVDSGEPFVLHDALCPMTPAAFIAECVALSRPQHHHGRHPARHRHRQGSRPTASWARRSTGRGWWPWASPLVLPLRGRGPSSRCRARPRPRSWRACAPPRRRDRRGPPGARRVTSAEEIALLEALMGEAR